MSTKPPTNTTWKLAAALWLIAVAAATGQSAFEAWVQRYDGMGDGDTPTAIAVDRSGNVVVTGSSGVGIGGNSDYATIKYSPAGLPLWTKHSVINNCRYN